MGLSDSVSAFVHHDDRFLPGRYETGKIIEALKHANVQAESIGTDRLLALIGRSGVESAILPLVSGGPPRLLLTRCGAPTPPGILTIYGILEDEGTIVLNSPSAMEVAADKARAQQRLRRSGVAVPKSLLIPCDPFDESGNYDRNGVVSLVGDTIGFDCVVKAAVSGGYGGQGVFAVRNESELNTLLDAKVLFGAENGPLLVQEMCVPGRDLRLFVVDGVVVSAMERTATRPGELRSNVSLGGAGSSTSPSEELVSLAVRAAAAVGLAIAGVDVIFARGDNAPLVCEVNSSPGFRGLDEVAESADSGAAKAIADLAARLVEE